MLLLPLLLLTTTSTVSTTGVTAAGAAVVATCTTAAGHDYLCLYGFGFGFVAVPRHILAEACPQGEAHCGCGILKSCSN